MTEHDEGVDPGLPNRQSKQPVVIDAGNGKANTTRLYRTACFACRAARQRCDRRLPCRCASQERPCSFPSGSNRGRKSGSTNKPDTVEKLLTRISESEVGDEVIQTILQSPVAREYFARLQSSTLNTPPMFTTAHQFPSQPSDISVTTSSADHNPDVAQEQPKNYEQEEKAELSRDCDISLLQIVSTAIKESIADLPQASGVASPSIRRASQGQNDSLDRALEDYFAPQAPHRSDWQLLEAQSLVDSPLKLDPATCDPLTGRLIEDVDASLYFDLFFEKRNPLVGLLDPTLHTPDYVYTTSFTLFSVICALGCAVSTRPRDRLLYPTLVSTADAGIKWSIATSVKTAETIQAIINMKYWAPACQRHSDDPYWLHLSHAAQIARELGINRPANINELVNSISGDASPDNKERLSRNFERTWLHIFIADKTFGVLDGRAPCVFQREVPLLAPPDWWKRPMTTPLDHMVNGVVEVRGLLLHALGQQCQADTLSSILQSHSDSLTAIELIRISRCTPDDLPSAKYLPLLAFYMDHAILLLCSQALKAMVALDGSASSNEHQLISQKAGQMAIRVLNSVLQDPLLQRLMPGFHNNQFIMICHAMTEALHAMKRGSLSSAEVTVAKTTMHAIPEMLTRIGQTLPVTSAVHLYIKLLYAFTSQLEKLESDDSASTQDILYQGDNSLFEWLEPSTGIDPTTWFDMGFLAYQ